MLSEDLMRAAVAELSAHLTQMAERYGPWTTTEIATLALIHGYEKAAEVIEGSLTATYDERLELLGALRTTRLQVINALALKGSRD